METKDNALVFRYKVEAESLKQLLEVQEQVVAAQSSALAERVNELKQTVEQLNDEIMRRQKIEETLEAANQQLRASEQQLRAANQQLRASEQQLRAANQQLRASEQQLRAANQQLRANEQQLRAEITERKKTEEALRESERSLAQAQQLAQVGSWKFIPATGKTAWSEEMFQIYGLEPANEAPPFEVLAQMVHEEDRQRWGKAIKEGRRTSRFYNFEYRIIRPDGQCRWLLAQESMKETPLVFYGTVLDITERKQAEEALTKSENKFRILFESSRDAIMTLEPPSWKFTSGNQTTVEMFMAKDEVDFTSREPWVLSPERQPDGRASIEKAKEMIEMAMRDGSNFFEWTHKRLNGEEFPATVLLTRMEYGGKVVLQATVRDISIQKQAEDNLKRQTSKLDANLKESLKSREILSSMLADNNRIKEELEGKLQELKQAQSMLMQSEKLASLGRLVSDMAHEVNNPLMIISGNAQLSLLDQSLSEELKNNLKIIHEECNRAKNIIQRLLMFSRPSKGESKPLEINQSILSVVKLLEHQFSLSNVKINKQFNTGLSLISIDEKQLQEVIMNLLNNARDAMPEGGEIIINTSLDGEYLKIEIKDSGVGMDDKALARVFEPFFTTKEKGTGLGLSVCYGIIKAHNGKIEFKSQPQKGATVHIWLPLKEGAPNV